MRNTSSVGAHAKGFNAHSIGIAYEGGLNEEGIPTDTRTTQQKQALTTLLSQLLHQYPAAHICGHRDLSPDTNGNGIIEPAEYIKMCPCFDAIPEYATLPVGEKTDTTASTNPQTAKPVTPPTQAPIFVPEPIKKEVTMKPFWKGTLNVLKMLCKFVTWLTGQTDNEGKTK